MQRGIRGYEATGTKLWSPYYLRLLADQLGKAGRVEEALAVIGKASNYSEESGERCWLAELYALKEELLRKVTPPARKSSRQKVYA